ncbi:maltooligosyl trehalose synthase [Devosia enhydra]|uniref:Maltooligosyl trehalose synthase n=1 Tax=Devosia enhydra TaxID=665118 RepID=A0A1K2I234_9HYPH|nr:malto-oligosyltrehalose synthase [Devosia enhydra]SFZ85812.1 maltooligosyl trehalose synthase [Devosia enhydra]
MTTQSSRQPALLATYRLQLSADFTFADATQQAGYIAGLGASHVYLSPILTARKGSTHGYDTVDHATINPELGGREGFDRMVEVFHAAGLRILLDIVPNHMGIGGSDNARWLDLLEWGRRGEGARWFDVDWESGEPALRDTVMVPVLGDGFAGALAAGAITLRLDAGHGEIAAWAHEAHKLPLAPPSYAGLLDRAGLGALARSFGSIETAAEPLATAPYAKRDLADALRDGPTLAALEAVLADIAADRKADGALARLLGRQHFRLVSFRAAGEALNYRRFFIVNDLGGIRIDRPEVFAAAHALVFELVAAGQVDALRVDHVDGLADPAGYLAQLAAACPRPVPIYVEKILSGDETLPADWPVAGTTGYEFAAGMIALLTDPAGEAQLSRAHAAFTGDASSFVEREVEAKHHMLAADMQAECLRLSRLMHRVGQKQPAHADLSLGAIKRALEALLVAMPVYRIYPGQSGVSAFDRAAIATARAEAQRLYPTLDPAALRFVAALALGDIADGASLEIARRFGQLSGPAMAKGLEDTALYRHARLISLNDVGARPDRFHTGIGWFHRFNAATANNHPQSLLATSTHDSKRGEDARARIAVLSGLLEDWSETLANMRASLAAAGAPVIDDEMLAYVLQSLIGVWPMDEPTTGLPETLCDRLVEATRKAAREARSHTHWTAPNAEYENRLAALIRHLLDDRPGNRAFELTRGLLARIGKPGAANAMLLTALKLTVPGVPDIYRGAEAGDQSLVDPDNRLPVDFSRLAGLGSGDGASFAARKHALTRTLLRLRQRHPALFVSGSYEPVVVEGGEPGRCLAFIRRHEETSLLVMAGLWPWRGDLEGLKLSTPQAFEGTTWQTIIGAGPSDPTLPLTLPADLPVLVGLSAR